MRSDDCNVAMCSIVFIFVLYLLTVTVTSGCSVCSLQRMLSHLLMAVSSPSCFSVLDIAINIGHRLSCLWTCPLFAFS